MPNENTPSTHPLTRRTLLGTAGLSSLALAGVALPAHADDHEAGDPNDLPGPDSYASGGPEGPHAFIDGTGHGWRTLGPDDFANVNGHDDTWQWRDDGSLHCTGQPLGVLRTAQLYTNFEICIEWCHRQKGGNSGLFVWSDQDVIEQMTAAGEPGLPSGIEVQMLDVGYAEVYRGDNPDRDTSWFTSHGDVFPVRQQLDVFSPTSPNGRRSFPTEDRVKPHDHWNHYYVRGINGEVRLWVNGKEVSGGNNASTTTGYLCLESEGAPIDFRNIRLRELP
ncbi:MAG: DUF1080 domain-containing protein [Planctomycetota bacterium]